MCALQIFCIYYYYIFIIIVIIIIIIINFTTSKFYVKLWSMFSEIPIIGIAALTILL